MKTAREFLEYSMKFPPESNVITHIMKEFAKMHVEEALKAAAHDAELVDKYYVNDEVEEISSLKQTEDAWGADIVVSPKSILNAYPLEKIQ